MSVRRGGIPGPESRTGLVRPAMSEAEFERRLAAGSATPDETETERSTPASAPAAAPEPESEPEPSGRAGGGSSSSSNASSSSNSSSRSRSRSRASAKARRVQRMFAIEEDLDKKLWLYAIHVGKDRSDVINDLLRPVVASMVLYDSRDRRSRSSDSSSDGDDESS